MPESVLEWLIRDQLTFAPMVSFALLFVASGLLPLPRSFLCVLAGTMFGASVEMALLAIACCNLGAAFAFLLARGLLSQRLQRAIDRRPRLRIIADAMDAESWRLMALCRFGLPVAAFFQNYVFGLSRIKFWPYLIVSVVFTTPQTLLFLYMGSLGRHALLNDWASAGRAITAAIALATTLAILFLITRRMRSLLAEREKQLAPN
jgi:uncharacterized membrane protein YdjX (TVP38/TMEM64 family)